MASTQPEPMSNVAPGTALAARLAAATSRRYTRSLWGDAWRRFRRHRLAMAGAVAFLFLTAATLAGPLVYSVPINAIDFKASMAPPSGVHPFGTNDLGQDMLAQIGRAHV